MTTPTAPGMTREVIEVLRVNLKGSQNGLWTEREELLAAHQKIDALCDLALRAEENEREIKRLRTALERLGSMEAFTVSRVVDKLLDEELLARIDYARSALDAGGGGK